MKAQLPFGVSSPDETPAWLRVERINLFPETAPDARSQTILRNSGGLILVGSRAGVNRGARVMGDSLYTVQGQRLIAWDTSFTDTNLGEILGTTRCVLADYFIPATSRQLAIGTGLRGYIYDTATGLVEITDSVFTDNAQKRTPVFVGGYLVWDTPDGMIWSDQQDFYTYPALNVLTAETVPDGVVGIVEYNGDVWLLGQRSIEVRRLTGLPDENAFALAQTMNYGVASPYAVVQADNRMFLLEARGRVYVSAGFSLQRISTPQIEQWLQSVDLSDAFMLAFVDRGHEFILLTVPGSRTEVYDVLTQQWSRRESMDGGGVWRPATHAYFNAQNIFGDFNSGKLRRLDKDKIWEGDEEYGINADEVVRTLITTYVHQDTDPLFATGLEVIAEVGTAPQTGRDEETAPVMEMRYSDDGGHNFNTFRDKSIGAIGEYRKRVRFDRLGTTRQRTFEIRISDPVRCDLILAEVSGQKGEIA